MIINSIIRIRNHFNNDSLFRNSVYLILGTVIQAGFGFIFWTVAAHLYSTSEIGISTTLVSSIALIGTLSVLGLNSAIIRYLPSTKDKNSYISTTIISASMAAIMVSIIYLCLIFFFAPKLLAGTSLTILSILVISGGLATTLYTLSDCLFIALRKSKFVTITALFYSLSKLIFIFIAIIFGPYGPFSAQVVGVLVAICVSAYAQIHFLSHHFKLHLDINILKKIRSFAGGSYLGSLANSLPGLLLPIVILNNLGAPSVAYFFVSLMVANVLFIIPQATTQAQFAEGANEPKYMQLHLKRAAKQIMILELPTIILTIVLAPYILSIFGKAYAVEGTAILRLLSLSAIWVSVNYVLTTVLRLKNLIRSLVIVSVVTTLATFFSAYVLIRYGLIGVGIGWNIGELLTSLLLIGVLLRENKNSSSKNKLI